jgi:hypothetical protein
MVAANNCICGPTPVPLAQVERMAGCTPTLMEAETVACRPGVVLNRAGGAVGNLAAVRMNGRPTLRMCRRPRPQQRFW